MYVKGPLAFLWHKTLTCCCYGRGQLSIHHRRTQLGYRCTKSKSSLQRNNYQFNLLKQGCVIIKKVEKILTEGEKEGGLAAVVLTIGEENVKSGVEALGGSCKKWKEKKKNPNWCWLKSIISVTYSPVKSSWTSSKFVLMSINNWDSQFYDRKTLGCFKTYLIWDCFLNRSNSRDLGRGASGSVERRQRRREAEGG